MLHDIGNLIFRQRRCMLIYWYRNDLTKSVIRFIDIWKCQIKVHVIPPYRSGNNETGLFAYDIYLTQKFKKDTWRQSIEIGLYRGRVLWIFFYTNKHDQNVLCTHGQGLRRMSVWFKLHELWNENIIILMKFSSLATQEVVSRCNQ